MSKKSDKKKRIIEEKTSQLNASLNNVIITNSLQENIKMMKDLFVNDDSFIVRKIDNNNNESVHFAITYCDGMVNATLISDNIITPLQNSNNIVSDNIIDILINKTIQLNEIKTTKNIKDIVVDITYGEVILFVDGVDVALILNTKLQEKRAITEPDSEKILAGPREGFTELLLTNISLVRRKLRTNQLKIQYVELGDISHTKACICYIDNIVNREALDEFKKRLKKIKIDGVLDTEYITELTKNDKISPFRTTGFSERPDVIVARLLEGRVAFILDGTPDVLTIPYLFVENFQSSEDYYFSYYYTSFSRLLRVLGFLLTVAIPALYISVVVFHKEMLPTPLFINFAIERSSVPLPAAAEIFVMIIIFDLLKETGARMPSKVGEALSIVGVIVIGQAAVEARLVAAPTIIIVALTGITSLLVPKLNASIIFARFLLLFLTSALGLYGFIIGFTLLLIHVLNLKSFNIPQIDLTGNFKFQNIKDIFFRSPMWKMIKRPKNLSNNKTRQSQNGVKQDG